MRVSDALPVCVCRSGRRVAGSCGVLLQGAAFSELAYLRAQHGAAHAPAVGSFREAFVKGGKLLASVVCADHPYLLSLLLLEFSPEVVPSATAEQLQSQLAAHGGACWHRLPCCAPFACWCVLCGGGGGAGGLVCVLWPAACDHRESWRYG